MNIYEVIMLIIPVALAVVFYYMIHCLLAERDAARAERDAAIAERDAAIVERDAARAAR